MRTDVLSLVPVICLVAGLHMRIVLTLNVDNIEEVKEEAKSDANRCQPIQTQPC
jgi:hypothetical protein